MKPADKLSPFRRDLCFSAILVLLILLAYKGPLIWDSLLDVDDWVLFSPFKTISNFTEYYSAWKKAKVLDIQPVRDFFIWGQIQLGIRFSGWNLHGLPLVLWGTTCLIIYRCLTWMMVRTSISMSMTLMLALHPSAVQSIAWFSSIKHILSTFFASLILLIIIGIRQGRLSEKWVISLAFLLSLSLFSQPINITYGIWIIVYLIYHTHFVKELRPVTPWLTVSVSLPVCGMIAFLNHWYYYNENSPWVKIIGGTKQSPFIDANPISLRLLALGRYMYQLLVPTRPSYFIYGFDSVENLLGLGILPIFLYLIYKSPRRNDILWFCIPGFAATFLMVIKLSHMFGMDTYLLPALVSFFLALGLILDSFLPIKGLQSNKQNKFLIVGSCIAIAILGLKTKFTADNWRNPQAHILSAALSEPNPFLLTYLAKSHIRAGDYDTARKVMETAFTMQNSVTDATMGSALGKAIYFSKELNPTKKLRQFEADATGQFPSFEYYWSRLLVDQNSTKKAFQILDGIRKEKLPEMLLLYNDESGDFLDLWLNTCLKAHAEMAAKCEKLYQEMKNKCLAIKEANRCEPQK